MSTLSHFYFDPKYGHLPMHISEKSNHSIQQIILRLVETSVPAKARAPIRSNGLKIFVSAQDVVFILSWVQIFIGSGHQCLVVHRPGDDAPRHVLGISSFFPTARKYEFMSLYRLVPSLRPTGGRLVVWRLPDRSLFLSSGTCTYS
jgi:hypothetical protein